MIPAPIRPNHPVVLDADQAADLAHLLDLIEDWLSIADTDAHAELADYLDGTGHGPLAALGLITTLQQATLALHQRLKEANQ